MTNKPITLTPMPDGIDLPDPEQQYRSGAYALLGALLRDVPSSDTLSYTAQLNSDANAQDDLGVAMSMLGLAASHSDAASVDDEYHTLFIGLGRGEVVPYGSWYLTGFLMEKPLGQLRDDLRALGFARDPAVKEPEDHIAAMCEVMAMMTQENRDLDTQQQFFSKHMMKWAGRFFEDLANAESASFYEAVARFGSAFITFEQQYFGLEI